MAPSLPGDPSIVNTPGHVNAVRRHRFRIPAATVSRGADRIDYRADVDGLRGIAVLAVVAFHAFREWMPGGYTGVDVFFVVSGFLISGLLLKDLEGGSLSFGNFYSRRVRRIFPALAVVLIACYGFGWLSLLPDEYEQLGKHIAGGAGFVSNFVLWDESGYFDNAAETKPLLHLWSLGIEEQFYIVWPALLYLAWRLRFNALWLMLVVLVASFAGNIVGIHADPVGTFYSPLTRFWELALGGLLACAPLRPSGASAARAPSLVSASGVSDRATVSPERGVSLRDACAVAGCVLLVTGAVALSKDSPFPGWRALLPALGTFLLIAAGPDAWINRAILSNRLLVGIGLVSYPLYLWHWPILSFAHVVQSGMPSLELRVIAVMASMTLAWLTYRFVERPIRFGPNARVSTLPLCLLMLAIGCVGYETHRREGLEFRQMAIKTVKATNAPAEPRAEPAVPVPREPDAPAAAHVDSAPVPHPPVASVAPDSRTGSARTKATSSASPPRADAGQIDKVTAGETPIQRYARRLAADPDYPKSLYRIRQAAIRVSSCQMRPDEGAFEEFESAASRCLSVSDTRRNVLIVGDSHAADLYAALASTHKEVNFLQATGAGCTPIADLHKDTSNPCSKQLAYVFRFLRMHKLDGVILAAKWPKDYERLSRDIAEIKAIGHRVIVVGPPAEFTAGVLRIIERRPSDENFDEYVEAFVVRDRWPFADAMRAFSIAQGAFYVDRLRLYCERTCPVLSPEGELYARDYGHLTAAGSTYLGRQIAKFRVMESFFAESGTDPGGARPASRAEPSR